MPERKTDAELYKMYHSITVMPYTSSLPNVMLYKLPIAKPANAKLDDLLYDFIVNTTPLPDDSNPQYWQYGYVKG